MEHLIAFGEDVFRVAGQVVSANDAGGSTIEVAAAYEGSSRRRKVTIDGSEPERIGDAIGRLGAVIFSPADMKEGLTAFLEKRKAAFKGE